MKYKDNELVERIIKMVRKNFPMVEYKDMGITNLNVTMKNTDDKDITVSVGRNSSLMPFVGDTYHAILILGVDSIVLESNNKLKKKLFNNIADLRCKQLQDNENEVRNSIKI